jgi:hypothetical protein
VPGEPAVVWLLASERRQHSRPSRTRLESVDVDEFEHVPQLRCESRQLDSEDLALGSSAVEADKCLLSHLAALIVLFLMVVLW